MTLPPNGERVSSWKLYLGVIWGGFTDPTGRDGREVFTALLIPHCCIGGGFEFALTAAEYKQKTVSEKKMPHIIT